MGEDDADRVASPGRDDRVDADTGEICAVDREPADPVLGIGSREDVAPRPAGTRELEQVTADRERQRDEVNRPELVEECVDPVQDADGHGWRYALALAV